MIYGWLASAALQAAKTAAGRLMAVSFCFHLGMKGDHPLYYVKGPIWSDSLKVKREKREHNAARRAFVESMVKIEIVQL